jgi:hypothetical protein
MPIRFNCTSCGRMLQAGAVAAGKAVSCPACHSTITVPVQQEQPSPANSLPAEPSPAEQSPTDDTDSQWRVCPACGCRSAVDAAICSCCGHSFLAKKTVTATVRSHGGTRTNQRAKSKSKSRERFALVLGYYRKPILFTSLVAVVTAGLIIGFWSKIAALSERILIDRQPTMKTEDVARGYFELRKGMTLREVAAHVGKPWSRVEDMKGLKKFDADCLSYMICPLSCPNFVSPPHFDHSDATRPSNNVEYWIFFSKDGLAMKLQFSGGILSDVFALMEKEVIPAQYRAGKR